MKICFAFLITEKINNESVWFDYLSESPNTEVIIHTAKPCKLKLLTKITNNIYENQVETRWGKLLEVQNFLLKKAKELNGDKSIFLSDSCLPIKPLNYLFELFSNDTSFISNTEAWDPSRFPVDYGIKYMANQQWVIIDKKHIDFFLLDELRNYFERRVVLPEESYYSTILEKLGLNNSSNVINEKTTYVDWSRPTNNGNSPHLFENNNHDISAINNLKEQKNILFCRKFSDLDGDSGMIRSIRSLCGIS